MLPDTRRVGSCRISMTLPRWTVLLLATLALCFGDSFSPVVLAEPTPSAAESPANPAADDDPFLWLEEITGTRALDWVTAQNSRTMADFGRSPELQAMSRRLLEIMDSKAKIPAVEKIGAYYYNFWRDQNHERGLWRRTTLAEFRKSEPQWETVLDLDALAKAEEVSWVWKGAQALPPDYTRCLLQLSRGGADAVEVREFDLSARAFVPEGFRLGEAKAEVVWKNRDTILIATDFGPGSLTTSGYPRIVKEWRRGTPLSAATLIFEGRGDDVGVNVNHEFTPGYERDLVHRSPTFFTNEMFVRQSGELRRIDKPEDADAVPYGKWLLIRLRTDWSAGGKNWPGGTLLVTPFEDFLAGGREMTVLFSPTPRTSLEGFALTRDAILLTELDNVRHRLIVARHDHGVWIRSPVAGLPEFGTLGAQAVDPLESNDFWLTLTDFLTPTRLLLGSVGATALEPLKQLPAYFDAGGLEVSQHEASSKDGTRVPYFQVSKQGLPLDGRAPTLLTGYGGFEVSELPFYNALEGAVWLEKGGVLLVANIRGGGEFGPAWHRAAIKANRLRAYEDFIAVAEDVVRRKVTSPRHLACMGGSNGGLLVGNMLVMRPDLFRAIVCAAPLLDMKRYHKLLAGASWMEEYGNPDLPEEWAFVRTFSPYHQLKPGVEYPRTLFLTSTRDDRVHPGHARKMMARMESLGHDAWFFENVEGGHAGAATNKQRAAMSALTFTFLWRELLPASSTSLP